MSTSEDRDILEHHLTVTGRAMVRVTRADGSVEEKIIVNQVLAEGLNKLAARGIANVASPFGFIGIGTVSAVASLDSTVTDFGEVDRKAAATLTTSLETMIGVATWAGFADTLTSVDLRSAGFINHANSGLGEMLNIVNSVATVLAASDFLLLQVEVRVGSH